MVQSDRLMGDTLKREQMEEWFKSDQLMGDTLKWEQMAEWCNLTDSWVIP